ncbi:MAG: hypothetical protein QW291_09815 [Thermofilaceae archaeon]
MIDSKELQRKLANKGIQVVDDGRTIWVTIPRLRLPPQFYPTETRLLIEYPKYGGEPKAYVDRRLRLRKGSQLVPSRHLPECLTPRWLLERGYVYVCMRIESPNVEFEDFLVALKRWLEGLRE